jgi:alpha-beta hydrolase superfamily lysophospholipase
MHKCVREFTFPSATGECDIFCRLWVPENVRCVVQLAHGVAEYIDRYDEFARFLNEHDILVAANDHAGHGKSIKDMEHLGWYGPENGWSSLLSDMHTLYKAMKQNYPDVPYVMMGHSMGAQLARAFASRHIADVDAYILSGTSGNNPFLWLGLFLSKRAIRKKGPDKQSLICAEIMNKVFNMKIKHPRTKFDWVSKDNDNVDRYIEDPLCGFPLTGKAYLDIFENHKEICSAEWASSVPDVPIFMFSGSEDPVGNYGKGVKEVCDWLTAAGKNVEMKLYQGSGHEVLNEANKREAYTDILGFLNGVIAKRGGTK